MNTVTVLPIHTPEYKVLLTTRIHDYSSGGFVDIDLLDKTQPVLDQLTARLTMSILSETPFEMPVSHLIDALKHAMKTSIADGDLSNFPSFNFELPAMIGFAKIEKLDRERNLNLIAIRIKVLNPAGKVKFISASQRSINLAIEDLMATEPAPQAQS